jgi:hypothetical protein
MEETYTETQTQLNFGSPEIASPYGTSKLPKRHPLLKCAQSIRTRSVIVLVVLFVVMFLAFLAVIAGVVPSNFSNVETTLASEALLRTTRGVFDQFSNQITIEVGFAAYVCVCLITTHSHS